MAQLLIVVMSIAMAATLLFAGSWYGGDAYTQSQGKGQAEQLIAGAEQIAQAWHAYANDNMSYAITQTNWNNPTNTDFVPKYMSQWPKFPFLTGCGGYAYPILLTSSGVTTNLSANSNVIQFCGVPKKVCEQINLMSQGSTTVPSDPSGTTIYNSSKPSFCYYNTSAVLYYMQYRVF